jgi:hypothetical protein
MNIPKIPPRRQRPSKIMKITACCLMVFLVLLTVQASGPETIVARIFDREISAAEIGLTYDEQGSPILPDHEATCVIKHPFAELQKIILQEMQRETIRSKGLEATDEEVLEMKNLQDKSMAEERIRRQRDLETIEAQLEENHLPAPEREKLETRLGTLQKLGEFEKVREGMPELTPEMIRMVHAPWIEAFKYHESIYREFGGVVASTKFGPDPVGAKAALAEQLQKDQSLNIYDSILSEKFWEGLRKSPRFELEKEKIDFTPFWKQTSSASESKDKS